MVIQILEHLQETRMNIGGEDRRVWRKGSGGILSARSCYEHAVDAVEVSGPWKVIRYNVILQFFLWTAVLDKISTMDML